MVFSSLIFLLAFLPLQYILYYSVKSLRARNTVLLVFSLIFYAWGEPVFVLVLVGMSFFCWLTAKLIDRSRKKGVRALLLAAAAVGTLSTLGLFKYGGFVSDGVNRLFGRAVLQLPEFTLPIGISFYTFQLLTYVADVYRGDAPAQRRYRKVLLYAGLFHQCVAGPIVRYGDIAAELDDRRPDPAEIARGASRFAVGLAKKCLLANACGAAADALLLSDAQLARATELQANLSLLAGRSALTLWAGMLFYMLQIYLDFSAYSDMAIGMGLTCGFHYRENFNYPYAAVSATDFWRRWHISLGSFFRDYVYIPLGGNRKGKARQIGNLFVVWALTGLWHGASWNFVLWGLYWFVLLLLEKFLLGRALQKTKVLRRVWVLAAVYFGWILFRFTELRFGGTVLRGMFCANGNPLYTFESLRFLKGYLPFLVLCALACTPIVKKLDAALYERALERRSVLRIYGVCRALAPTALIVLSVLALV